MTGIKKTMDEFKAGKLKSSSGQKVTNRKQAIAIGLSEQQRGMPSVTAPSVRVSPIAISDVPPKRRGR